MALTKSSNSWRNEETSATCAAVALAYASDTFNGEDLLDAKRILAAFAAGDLAWKKALEEVASREFADAETYLKWAQFRALFAKSLRKEDLRRLEDVATRKFLAAERACIRANKRLRFYKKHSSRENPIYRAILTDAAQFIASVIGHSVDDSVLEEVLDAARPGSGSCIGSSSPFKTSPAYKVCRTPLTISDSARSYGRLLVEGSPTWFRHVAEVDWSERRYRVNYQSTNFNRIAFVPKDSTTHRTIAVEPNLNMCLQLGVDTYFKRRLRRFGIDLSSQERNQRLARLASETWHLPDPYVTMDLAAASDSISIAVVERLLPDEWVWFLDDLRSPAYKIKGELHTYHKWSSMGNGYTFPLETLIFAGVLEGCQRYHARSQGTRDQKRAWSVYGDDLICRRSCAALVIEVLRYLGFRVNVDKTFIFGPFRESCGTDWWNGTLVTPQYLRGIERVRPTDIYRLLNRKVGGYNVRRLLLQAHQGQRILYGIESPILDASACLWLRRADLHRHPCFRWKSKHQSYYHEYAKFTPARERVGDSMGLVASLLGAGNLHLAGSLEAKLALRRRGFWSTSWRACS